MNQDPAYLIGYAFGVFIVFFIMATVIVHLIAMWKIYVKAGYEGWEAIIPLYNLYVLLKIVGKPWWWMIILFLPIVNAIFAIWMYNMLSKSFGKDEGFTVGLVLLSFIFLPILAFGRARYIGPYGDRDAFQVYQSRTKFDFEG